jgi:hypothetical protein
MKIKDIHSNRNSITTDLGFNVIMFHSTKQIKSFVAKLNPNKHENISYE